MNTFTVNEIAKRLNISYQTVRYRVAKLFGRTTGVFTEDEANQVAYFYETSQRLDCTAKVLDKQIRKMSEKGLPESSGRLTENLSLDEMDKLLSSYNTLPLSQRIDICKQLSHPRYDTELPIRTLSEELV